MKVKITIDETRENIKIITLEMNQLDISKQIQNVDLSSALNQLVNGLSVTKTKKQ